MTNTTIKTAILTLILAGVLMSGCLTDTETAKEDARFIQICNDKNITLVTTPPASEPAQDPDVEDRICTKFDGQEIHIKCKVLIVPTDGGTIYIENDDIEVISVIGNGNMIAYPSTANPEIRDVGSYNDIFGSVWL